MSGYISTLLLVQNYPMAYEYVSHILVPYAKTDIASIDLFAVTGSNLLIAPSALIH
jgi:hypothetical protein